MENLKAIINDVNVFSRGLIMREGFPFTCITEPTNVYDAIVVKPNNAQIFVPNYPNRCNVMYTNEEYVEFINKYHLEKAFIIADDISFLEHCPTLKYLKIVPSNTAGDDFDFSPLEKLPEVKFLNCETKYGFNFSNSSSIDYSNIKGVEAIHLVGEGHINSKILTTVKSCNISESPKKSLLDVISSTNLDYLILFQNKFKSLEGIEIFKKLNHLKLSYNRFLEDLSALELLGNSLKELKIENCPKIKDFSFLEKLVNLEVLTIYGKNSLPSLDFIKKLKKLRCFAFNVVVENGDLSPCLNVEHVYSAIDKNHYNLKNKDLPKSAEKIQCINIDEWRKF